MEVAELTSCFRENLIVITGVYLQSPVWISSYFNSFSHLVTIVSKGKILLT